MHGFRMNNNTKVAPIRNRLHFWGVLEHRSAKLKNPTDRFCRPETTVRKVESAYHTQP